MTRPVTTVAALMLLDEGRFALDDPITTCALELANVRVLRDPEGPLDASDEATRSITFRDLLTHRSGLTVGDFHRGPIRPAYAETLGAAIDNPLAPDEWIGRVATLPFIDQPGRGFHYGISTDLLGFLVARLAGASLGEVLARRIFAPLGMRDTGFAVPRAKRDRRAALCGFDDDGMGVAVVLEPDRADPMRCRGGIGTIGWPGAYGGWWQADPNDRSVLIFLTHNMLELSQLARGIGLGAWSAIGSFHAIATS